MPATLLSRVLNSLLIQNEPFTWQQLNTGWVITFPNKFHSAHTHLSGCFRKVNIQWAPSMCILHKVHLLKWVLSALGTVFAGDLVKLTSWAVTSSWLSCTVSIQTCQDWRFHSSPCSTMMSLMSTNVAIMLMRCWLVAACAMLVNRTPAVWICLNLFEFAFGQIMLCWWCVFSPSYTSLLHHWHWLAESPFKILRDVCWLHPTCRGCFQTARWSSAPKQWELMIHWRPDSLTCCVAFGISWLNPIFHICLIREPSHRLMCISHCEPPLCLPAPLQLPRISSVVWCRHLVWKTTGLYLCKWLPRHRASNCQGFATSHGWGETFSFSTESAVIAGHLKSVSPHSRTSGWSWQRWLLPVVPYFQHRYHRLVCQTTKCVTYSKSGNYVRLGIIFTVFLPLFAPALPSQEAFL